MSDTYLDLKTLTANRVAGRTGEHEIEGLGKVRFRALSREELITAGDISEKKGVLAYEQFALSRAMLNPKMTEAQVAEWQANSPGMEINDIASKINALCGVKKGADKSLVSDVPEQA